MDQDALRQQGRSAKRVVIAPHETHLRKLATNAGVAGTARTATVSTPCEAGHYNSSKMMVLLTIDVPDAERIEMISLLT